MIWAALHRFNSMDIRAKDRDAYNHFVRNARTWNLDQIRESMPKEWTWIRCDADEVQSDMPSAGVHVAFSSHAHAQLTEAFPGVFDEDIEITVDGVIYYCHLLPLIDDASKAEDLPDVFVIRNGYLTMVSDRFRSFWEAARLQGLGFVAESDYVPPEW